MEFGGKMFEISRDGTEGRSSSPNPIDVKRTVDAIREAKMTCEAVLVMVHSHEIRKDNDEEADYFLEEFAHACIDAGASAVIGGGTHQLKGIELYHDCPIFYCLGNFIFEISMYAFCLRTTWKIWSEYSHGSIHRNRQKAGAVLTFPLRNSGGLSECAAVFRDL